MPRHHLSEAWSDGRLKWAVCRSHAFFRLWQFLSFAIYKLRHLPNIEKSFSPKIQPRWRRWCMTRRIQMQGGHLWFTDRTKVARNSCQNTTKVPESSCLPTQGKNDQVQIVSLLLIAHNQLDRDPALREGCWAKDYIDQITYMSPFTTSGGPR